MTHVPLCQCLTLCSEPQCVLRLGVELQVGDVITVCSFSSCWVAAAQQDQSESH